MQKSGISVEHAIPSHMYDLTAGILARPEESVFERSPRERNPPVTATGSSLLQASVLSARERLIMRHRRRLTSVAWRSREATGRVCPKRVAKRRTRLTADRTSGRSHFTSPLVLLQQKGNTAPKVASRLAHRKVGPKYSACST